MSSIGLGTKLSLPHYKSQPENRLLAGFWCELAECGLRRAGLAESGVGGDKRELARGFFISRQTAHSARAGYLSLALTLIECYVVRRAVVIRAFLKF